MTKVTFKVEKRTITGKAVKKLRSQHLVPANIHGDINEPLAITVPEVAFEKLYDQVGDTGLVYIQVKDDTKQHPVLIDGVETDSVSGDLIHVVFKQVSLKEKVNADIPIEVIGEVDVPESVLMTIRDSIEVEALPTDFPEKIEVDVSGFTEIGDMITVADLSIDTSKVTIIDFEELKEKPVVILQAQQEQAEPEEEETTAEGEEGAESAAEGDSGASAEAGEDTKSAE